MRVVLLICFGTGQLRIQARMSFNRFTRDECVVYHGSCFIRHYLSRVYAKGCNLNQRDLLNPPLSQHSWGLLLLWRWGRGDRHLTLTILRIR